MSGEVVPIGAGRKPAAVRPLREDVPPFDPTNDAHLRAWESMWDFAVLELAKRDAMARVAHSEGKKRDR